MYEAVADGWGFMLSYDILNNHYQQEYCSQCASELRLK